MVVCTSVTWGNGQTLESCDQPPPLPWVFHHALWCRNQYKTEKMCWDTSAICSDDPNFGGTGNRTQGDMYPAAPNVDHCQVCRCRG